MAILIKNGMVYDGAGGPPIKTDVVIQGKKIVRLGTFSHKSFDEVVDATDLVVAPGFIDVNTSADHYMSIFRDPCQEDFVRQGVTTIIGGNCGVSLAPLTSASLEVTRIWSDWGEININWHTIHEFLSVLERRKLGINFGTLVGYTTIRQSFFGTKRRDVTDREITAIKEMLIQAFRDGAFGVSTGLEHISGLYIPFHELLVIAKIAASSKRLYVTHLRSSGDRVRDAFQEVYDLVCESNVPVHISHFQPIRAYADVYRELLKTIEALSATMHIHFDCSPVNVQTVPLHSFLPLWAQDADMSAMFSSINDQKFEQRLLEHFKSYDFDAMTIGAVPHALHFFTGKPFKTFAATFHMRSAPAFLHLMRLSHLRSVIFYRTIHAQLLDAYVRSPQALIASNWASFSGNSLCREQCNIFPRYLTGMTKQGTLLLEKAIEKLTSLPAEKYGIRERGFIRPGFFADIVLLDKNFEPISVFVNGARMIHNGSCTHVLSGSVLRRMDI